MADIKYEIIDTIATLSTSAKGWTRELNIISWNEGAPKFDIRDWAPDHDKMGKGITLNAEEATALRDAFNRILEEKDYKDEDEEEAPAPQPKPLPKKKAEEPKPQPKSKAKEPEKVEAEVVGVPGLDADKIAKYRALMASAK